MCFQAGLPLQNFYAVQDEPNLHKKEGFLCGNVWLKKVLTFTDEEFTACHEEWACHMQSLLESNPAAKHCRHMLSSVTDQLCKAIEQYGFLREVLQEEEEGRHI